MLADRARPGPGGRSMVAASASALGRPAPIDQDLQQGLHDVQALLQLLHALAQGLTRSRKASTSAPAWESWASSAAP